MTDIFVSYKKSDRDRVRPLVERLREAGFDVWWDEAISPSMSWRAEIAARLKEARCVVAVWTHDSVDIETGQWVMEEAAHGLSRRVLAPVRLDLVSPPLGFGEIQYADLAAWSGRADDPRFQHFLGVVGAIVSAEPIAVGPTPTQFEAPGIRLQNVTLENVQIEITEGPRRREDEEDAEEEDDGPIRLSRRVPLGFAMARLLGIVLPLAAIMTYVFTVGGAACSRGDAPAVLCHVLNALRASAK